VADLCDAHWRALQQLRAGSLSGTQAFNPGNGQGYSVQEVITAAERVTGQTIPVINAPRRAGDPARLVADSLQARQLLGWVPQYADLETIIRHAWAWENRLKASS
jgi:UDP-glucose 4-epimerase